MSPAFARATVLVPAFALSFVHPCRARLGAGHRPTTLLGDVRKATTSVADAPPSISARAGECPSLPLKIYDSVFDPASLAAVRELADDHMNRSKGTGGSSYFTRQRKLTDPPLTALERVIDSTLAAMGDDAPIVEYWSRDEYVNLDIHADLDEVSLEEEAERCEESSDGEGCDATLRFPERTHLLYLHDIFYPAPTWVFLDRLGGWDGLNATDARRGTRKDCERKKGVEAVAVPPRGGRLLRFDGRAMHGVPRPFDRWLRSDVEEELVARYLEYNDDDDFSLEDYNDDVDNSARIWFNSAEMDQSRWRPVLVFNTWRDHIPHEIKMDVSTGEGVASLRESNHRPTDSNSYYKPDVPEDPREQEGWNLLSKAEQKGKIKQWMQGYFTKEMNEGCEEDREDGELLSKWEEEFGDKLEGLRCRSPSEWTKAQIDVGGEVTIESSGDLALPMRANLLGHRARRLHQDTTGRLIGPVGLTEKLFEAEQPVRFMLANKAV